jgi:hypothetical protein
MVFSEGVDFRRVRRPGEGQGEFRSPVRFADVPDIAVVDGLIAWYRFEDSSNTAIDYTDDLSVGANQTAFDGTVNGASFQSSGGVRDVVSGQSPSGAYDFDGVDDSIQTSVTPPSQFTIMAWVELDQNQTDAFTSVLSTRNEDGTEGEVEINANPGPGSFAFTVDRTGVGGFRLTRDTYVHLSGVFDGTQARFFADGERISVETGLSADSSKSFDIGRRPAGDNELNGIIDDVRVYNRVLSASEINQIYINTDPDQ